MQILIVDDTQVNLTLFSVLVNKIENVTSVQFLDPKNALTWCEGNVPDLVLLDFMMPEINGFEFIGIFRKLKGCENIPVVMITTQSDREIRHLGLECGANDFLTKPIDKIEFLARVKNMLALREAQKKIEDRAEWLYQEVKKATEDLLKSELELIHRLSRAAEYRDPETGSHLLRMSNYSKLIAKNIGLSEADQDLILKISPMHDLGKIGIPDHILLKPGRLESDEMEIMKKHAEFGAEILKDGPTLITQSAAIVAATHHEKFDGTGYPKGLKGDEIPLFGRIVAVADVFDALTSSRPYKKAWSIADAKNFIISNSGTHFDPICVNAFIKDWEAVLEINQRFQEI